VDATVEYTAFRSPFSSTRNRLPCEAFAAAIQAHKRGYPGIQTYGKGVGQTIHEILDEGTLHLVEANVLLSRVTRIVGRPGHHTGLIVVETTKEDAARAQGASGKAIVPRLDDRAAIDPVLRKAFECWSAPMKQDHVSSRCSSRSARVCGAGETPHRRGRHHSRLKRCRPYSRTFGSGAHRSPQLVRAAPSARCKAIRRSHRELPQGTRDRRGLRERYYGDGLYAQ